MELVKPCIKYYPSYLEAIAEYQRNHVTTYEFLGATEQHIFEKINDYETGRNLPAFYVRATYLWLVEEEEFIGEISIRHSLTDSLLRLGGNIGYGIRYSQWNHGMGTIMLSKALRYAKEVIGLKKALITCRDTNIASARVIEKNGGILQDKIENKMGDEVFVTRRYWFELA